MNNKNNEIKMETFKIPETKIIKRLKNHETIACFTNNIAEDKLTDSVTNSNQNDETISKKEKFEENGNDEKQLIQDKSTIDKIPNVKSSDINEKSARDFSPAERLKTLEAILPYRDPSWTGVCEMNYFLEEIKNGIIVAKVDLTNKQRLVFGRLPSSDHVMEHPSISRHHAILQYKKIPDVAGDVGWYLYDLDSIHGTWLNKKRTDPSVYIRLKVGFIIKFGGSTRIFILQGPDEDREAESDLSVTELKELRAQQLRELELRQMVEDADALRKQAEAEVAASRDSDFCSWGMMEDATEEDQSDEANPFSTYEISPLELDDPKKTLRGYFDREGVEMPEYVFEELGFGKRVCRIELPIDNELGEPVTVEITGTGKKKDLVIQTALEACRMLDKHGLLRVVAQESRAEKRKRNWKDEDFYDSDEDVYLDRTGTIETKRRMRMSKVDPKLSTHTFESLTSDISALDSEIVSIDEKLETDRMADDKLAEDQSLDSLDAFMVKIKSGGMDTKTKFALKKRLIEAKAKRSQLDRLLKAVTPAIQPIKSTDSNLNSNTGQSESKDVTSVHSKSVENNLEFKADSNSAGIVCEPSKKSSSVTIIGKIKKATSTLKGRKFEAEVILEARGIENDDEDDDVAMDEQLNCDKADSAALKRVGDLQSVDLISPSLEDFHRNNDSKVVERTSDIDENNSSVEETKPKDFITKQISKSKNLPYNSNNGKSNKLSSKNKNASSNFEEINWLPPTGQSGDGKTKLNEKYGY